MSPPVPFLDVQAAYLELQPEIDAATTRVMASGQYLHGPENEAFEAEFAAYCESTHCVALGSGLDALELSLRALGIGPGDEVVVPSHTFVATWLAVSRTGARPVPVEPPAAGFTLDPARIEDALTPATAAIVPVHLYGEPADLDAIDAIARRHGLAVVEDVAQGVGARHRGRRLGHGSTAAAFSFYPAKNLGGMGNGGAVVSADPDLTARIRLLANYGSRRKYHHDVQGTNSRLDELQAAVLRIKLTRLDEWNARRTALAHRYGSGLAGLRGIRVPGPPLWAESAWHLYVLRCADRETVRRVLTDADVHTLIHYPVPVHLSPAYAVNRLAPGSLPHAEALAGEVLSLPIGPHLAVEAVDRVVDALRRWAG